MALVVQKYGGSSVADAECIRRVASRIAETRRAGNGVVCVVSAMGKTTNNLIELAYQVTPSPSDREMDMLLSTGEQISVSLVAMALHELGLDAASLTGPQAGILTDHVHTKAKITGIEPERVRKFLDDGHVVVVAGFQGLTPTNDIATLGRGASDLTAVALAVALQADVCQIYTDVEGVYTADPRIVPEARKLKEIAYDEMLELASLGAKVLQSRSVEFAKKYGVTLEVLSSFNKVRGTIVKEEVKSMEDIVVRGVSMDKNQAKVTLKGLPDEPGAAAGLFTQLARANINIDMIIQNVGEHGEADISFTVTREDLPKTRSIIQDVAQNAGAKDTNFEEDICKISIVGVGMRGHSGVACRMFQALADNAINIEMIATSEIKVSAVIKESAGELATQALHKAFQLEKE